MDQDMVFRYLLPIVVCLLVTLGMWQMIERTRLNFRMADIEAEAKQKGGMTEEMHNDYRGELLKSDFVSFGTWGAVLAMLAGCASNPFAKHRLRGAVIGAVLGALGGMLGAYLGQLHSMRVEYTGASSTFWPLRWLGIALPMGISAAVASATSGNIRQQLTDCLVGSIMGVVAGIVVVCFVHGLATPLEKSENVYPGWWSNRLLAMLSMNMGVFSMILAQAGRSGSKSKTVNIGVESQEMSEQSHSQTE
jgi:hypothetical protein